MQTSPRAPRSLIASLALCLAPALAAFASAGCGSAPPTGAGTEDSGETQGDGMDAADEESTEDGETGDGGNTGNVGPGACGPDDPPAADPACAGAEAAAIDSPVGLDEEMYNAVFDAQWDALYGSVGQYACGDSPVYTGSFWVPDSIDSDNVFASLVSGDGLDWVTSIAPGPHLQVFSPDDQKRTRLRQQPDMAGTTDMSIIAGYNQSFGVTGSCQDCLVDLTTKPDTIEIDLVVNGEYGLGDPLQIEAVGSLVQVPVEDLTFADITEVTQLYSSVLVDIIEDFESCGSELVRFTSGIYSEPAAAPAGSGWSDNLCSKTVTFEATWYLDPEAPGHHGIRALTLGDATYCCEELQVGEGPYERECF